MGEPGARTRWQEALGGHGTGRDGGARLGSRLPQRLCVREMATSSPSPAAECEKVLELAEQGAAASQKSEHALTGSRCPVGAGEASVPFGPMVASSMVSGCASPGTH